MDGGAGGALTDELGLLGGGDGPGVLGAAVQPVTVRAGRSRAVKGTHHVGILHIQHDHVAGIAERGELDATHGCIDRQALIGYCASAIPSRLREDVVKIEGTHGFVLIKR